MHTRTDFDALYPPFERFSVDSPDRSRVVAQQPFELFELIALLVRVSWLVGFVGAGDYYVIRRMVRRQGGSSLAPTRRASEPSLHVSGPYARPPR